MLPPRLHTIYPLQKDPSVLLPPLCPECLAPGTERRLVMNPELPSEDEPQDPLLCHYCSPCAARADAQSTRALARRLALTMLLLCLCLALFLWDFSVFGTALLLGGLALSFEFLEQNFWQPSPALWLGPPSSPPQVCCARPELRDAWLQAEPRLQALPSRVEARPLVQPSWGLRALPIGLALVLLSFLQLWGQSEVLVYDGGARSTLLVDGRKGPLLSRLLEESPTGLFKLRLRAGKHRLALWSEEGEIRADLELVLRPGGLALFGFAPAGRCLALETRTYDGQVETQSDEREYLSSSQVYHLLPRGPLLLFRPLPPETEFSSRGGHGRALRLLPCRRGRR